MPRTTVYIRKDDYEKWKAIENKAELISQAVNGIRTTGHAQVLPATPQPKSTVSGHKMASFGDKDDTICPHGYGKGLCKKPECNRKFA